eukprot:CAMPEP_0194138156 /NCGR_PEP_ID=MMETSP0152-20130528/8004_1 /TAXON_ID=1049557 /ORGANISM="Thalassiothrix antarctica, Strain L6-D1" /LENGTH=102 /DNA_ID=CAMNT_0038835523 /DNA_START=223 /DNA_END=528 /DNA_ORIENTATION=-
MPVLVLERLCFGTADDEAAIVQELKDVFELANYTGLDSLPVIQMPYSERQKAVTMAFNLVDTLKWWSNKETEGLFKRNSKRGKAMRNQLSCGSICWDGSKSV